MTLTIQYVYQDKDRHATIQFSKQRVLQLFPFFNIQLGLEGVRAICKRVWGFRVLFRDFESANYLLSSMM